MGPATHRWMLGNTIREEEEEEEDGGGRCESVGSLSFSCAGLSAKVSGSSRARAAEL